jgi:hypothetical protein
MPRWRPKGSLNKSPRISNTPKKKELLSFYLEVTRRQEEENKVKEYKSSIEKMTKNLKEAPIEEYVSRICHIARFLKDNGKLHF